MGSDSPSNLLDGLPARAAAGQASLEVQQQRWRWPALAGLATYVAWTAYFTGLRPEHIIIAGLFAGLFLWSTKSFEFGILCLPFLMVGVAYENLPLLFDLRGEVHVADLYAAEKAFFGIGPQAQILPEFFAAQNHAILDFFCGFAYITYLAESFLLGAYFYFKHKQRLRRLAWAFLLVNLMGMAVWILYPAAPPWYVAQHGLGPAVLDAAPSAAGAARFDALIGVGVFQSFYGRNANVFGAMPSLHCAYPTIVVLVSWSLGWRWRIPTIGFMLLVAFSAVYLQHHYVLDVLFGIIFALVAYWAVDHFLKRIQAPSQEAH